MNTTLPVLCLIVEDEMPVRKFLRVALNAEGHRVIESASATEAVQLVASHNPEIVLLDLGLPDGDGIEVTKKLREWSSVPIIVLSARGGEGDKVAALDAGADDYLTKPFSVQELKARMRVALRHARAKLPRQEDAVMQFGALRVDLARREVAVDGRGVKLTPIEYKLLALLSQNAGRVLTHRFILNAVWGSHATAQSHYVRVHMAELRKKIEPDPAKPQFIVTEQGVGYRLREAAV